MVEDGTEFVMGPPPGLEKTYGAHRDAIQYKLEPRITAYAKKLRQMYYRENTFSPQKQYLEALRVRQPTDTLEAMIDAKLVPAVIEARDEFADEDLVFAWKSPYKITRTPHGHMKPWYVVHPETEEEIRVTSTKIHYHGYTRLPYFINF
jgi:hypothetical protein